jgi:hypothetical protein
MHLMLLHIVVRTKMCLFGNEQSLFAPRYFHSAASLFWPLRVQFSLVGRVSLEHLPEDGLVRPKHVAIKCDFNDI